MPKDVTKLQISYRKHVTVFVLCLWNVNGGMWGLVNEEMDVIKGKDVPQMLTPSRPKVRSRNLMSACLSSGTNDTDPKNHTISLS